MPREVQEDSPTVISNDNELETATSASCSKKRHRSKGNAPMYNVRVVLYGAPLPTNTC
jgi:hypothetical protein